MDLLEFMIEPDIYHYLVLKNMMPFRIALDILLHIISAVSHIFSCKYEIIKIDSFYSLPPEKKNIEFSYVIIIIFIQVIKITTTIIYS